LGPAPASIVHVATLTQVLCERRAWGRAPRLCGGQARPLARPAGRAPASRRPKVLSVSPRRRCGRGRAGWAAGVFLDTPTIHATMVLGGGRASSAGGAPGRGADARRCTRSGRRAERCARARDPCGPPVHRASSAAPHGGPRLTIVGRARSVNAWEAFSPSPPTHADWSLSAPLPQPTRLSLKGRGETHGPCLHYAHRS